MDSVLGCRLPLRSYSNIHSPCGIEKQCHVASFTRIEDRSCNKCYANHKGRALCLSLHSACKIDPLITRYVLTYCCSSSVALISTFPKIGSTLIGMPQLNLWSYPPLALPLRCKYAHKPLANLTTTAHTNKSSSCGEDEGHRRRQDSRGAPAFLGFWESRQTLVFCTD